MPSELPQLNVRLQPETLARLVDLQTHLQAERGHPVSQSEVVAWAITQGAKKIPRGDRKKT